MSSMIDDVFGHQTLDQALDRDLVIPICPSWIRLSTYVLIERGMTSFSS